MSTPRSARTCTGRPSTPRRRPRDCARRSHRCSPATSTARSSGWAASSERWRNNGIGTRITEALLDHVRELGGPGTFVGLMAAAGAGPFYERFGFQPRGEDRPGMWLTL
jgi:GNAT superfamily N-acetyltransferase